MKRPVVGRNWVIMTGRAEYEEGSAVSPFVKYTLFVLNFIFWVVGVALVVIGSWALATKELEKMKRATSAWDYVFDITIIIIVLGFFIVCISTAGCVGALRENVCFLTAFWAMLIVIVVAFLLIGIIGFAMNSYFLNLVKDELSSKWIVKYYDDADLKDITDFFQEKFSCCGLSDEGFVDWGQYNVYHKCSDESKIAKETNPWACSVPSSCCRPATRQMGALENFQCGQGMLKLSHGAAISKIYVRGCVGAMVESVKKNVVIICGVALATALLPMFQIVLAVTLVSQINEQKSKWQQSGRRLMARNVNTNVRYL